MATTSDVMVNTLIDWSSRHRSEALVKGAPQGGRIALTAFRDKVEQWWKG